MTQPSRVRSAFEPEVLTVPLASIATSKVLEPRVLRSVKFRRIGASIAQVGLIEPLAVTRTPGGGFRLLDGHARLAGPQVGRSDGGALPRGARRRGVHL